jgi:hypothetical protein
MLAAVQVAVDYAVSVLGESGKEIAQEIIERQCPFSTDALALRELYAASVYNLDSTKWHIKRVLARRAHSEGLYAQALVQYASIADQSGVLSSVERALDDMASQGVSLDAVRTIRAF